ncbi:hypothetical protein PBI_TOAKA_40 [Mycobacterium phage Toaka]|nr:hypothetical protein PBI_TOAKA_40 [Mycobacterium phage Toaka]
MADHDEFFDVLYQQWSKTTGAKDTYWMPEETAPPSVCETDTGLDGFVIKAVNPNTEEWSLVASHLSDDDAEFIAGLHGAIPDLIRHLGEATDRAERFDEARDLAEGRYAEVLLENAALRDEVKALERELDR